MIQQLNQDTLQKTLQCHQPKTRWITSSAQVSLPLLIIPTIPKKPQKSTKKPFRMQHNLIPRRHNPGRRLRGRIRKILRSEAFKANNDP